MIRFSVTQDELRALILEESPTWYDQASVLIASLPPNPTSKQFVSLWGDIKAAYIKLQGSKCIYCESLLEGNIANDVEHFRPKAKVSAWKVPSWLAREGVTVTPPATPQGEPGYRELAYHPWNYAASCKFCNSVLKKNHFPISGTRLTTGNDPRSMKDEQPMLIYPIDDLDDDPETLIRFEGMHPKPAVSPGQPGHTRALVTIEFFRLDDAERRKELYRARALLLGLLHEKLENLKPSRPKSVRKDAAEWVEILRDHKMPHANCVRCFIARYEDDPSHAKRLVDDVKAFLKSGSPTAPT